MKKYDHIIVGTGQATGTLLGKLIPTGDTIAVIEGNKVGGSCVNYGCTPTKTLVASARAFHQAKRGDTFGFSAKPELNFKRVMERMNEVRGASNEGLTEWMESTENVTLIKEYASFSSEKVLKVGDQKIEGDNIYLNVGTRPRVPDIEGLAKTNWLDSAKLLELEELPEHLIIIGGGYIGLEFAQVFRRFGSRVSIIQADAQLLPYEDEDIAQSVTEVLENEGIEIYTKATTLEATESNCVNLKIEHNGKSKTISGSHLLVATGRVPNSDLLNLEKIGIETEKRGYIQVDDYCQTNVKNVFAVGDVNGQGAFTHTAVNDAEIVLDYLFDGDRTLKTRHTIYSLFTDPPLGRVGLSEKEAAKKGHKMLKATMPMSEISRAKEMSETQGMAKLIVDANTDLILGAAIHGPGGDEIINMFAAIIHSKIPCYEYRKVVLVHPTVAELMPFALDGLEPVE